MTRKVENDKSTTPEALTRGSVLFRNSLWNLAGQVAPLLAALVAIPLLIKYLGTDRYAVLTLMWILIGYFSLFDFGLGRALTKLVAERLGSGRDKEIPQLVWTGLFFMTLLGCAVGAILAVSSSWLIREVLKVPVGLQSETHAASLLLAVSIPFVVVSAGLRGLLEAQQRFDLANTIRIPVGLFLFLGPLMVLPFTHDLFYVVAVLLAGRVIAMMVNLWFCLRTLPLLRGGLHLERMAMKSLFQFGGWMTVSNVISPLMERMDRFLIGAFVSVTAVAYYATPYEVVTKLWLVPAAIVGTLFPAFAVSFLQDHEHMNLLFRRGLKYIFLALFPVTLVVISFSYDGLNLWLGSEFAEQGVRVLQLLAIGVFINSLAQVPFVLLQGAGRPDITAKLHLVELPLYLPLVFLLISRYNIEGAALAWVIRMGFDALLLFLSVLWILPVGRPRLSWRAVAVAGSVVFVFIFAMASTGVMIKGVFLTLVLLIFALISWFFFFSRDERALAQKIFRIRVTTGRATAD